LSRSDPSSLSHFLFKLQKIPSEPLADTAPDSFGLLIRAHLRLLLSQQPLCTNLSSLVFQKQASSGPVSSHCISSCMRACGVSQQSAEGNCDGVRVWGLKSATISPSLVTPGTRTSLLPFRISSCRRVPFRLLSLPIYVVIREATQRVSHRGPCYKEHGR